MLRAQTKEEPPTGDGRAAVSFMHRVRISAAFALLAQWLLVQSAFAQPQSEARQRQAAAEAYDQGTAAYLSGDYEKAAEWFETANRMSPAVPALIQAARAHQQAGHLTRAATLALRLTLEHGDDATATQFGRGVLDKLAPQFVRVDVACEGCTLDVDGTLQESPSFFVEPGDNHRVTASFETGERHAEVGGQAGETKTLEFSAPPPTTQPEQLEPGTTEGSGKGQEPLPPVYTFVGAGITGALVIASVISTVDMYSGVDPYEKAGGIYQSCLKKNPSDPGACNKQHETALNLYNDGHGKETRTTVFWVVTGVAAAATGAIALFFTNWSGHGSAPVSQEHALRVGVAPSNHGMNFALQGRF
jgi:tetratricopeptide (TPR) repeat protein